MLYMRTFNDQEIKAARILQLDIPLVSQPFAEIAGICGMNSNALLLWMKNLCEKGIIRKFGAILRHQKAGYGRNALITWAVPSEKIENAGRLLSTLPFVSHCYERKPAFENNYNLFTMMHTQSEDIMPLVNSMSRLINQTDFLVLESGQEFKKTSPEYF